MEPDDYRRRVEDFVRSRADRHTLGLVYGRRRIGKSTLVETISHEHRGFYWEATRTESAVQLARLGEALGAYLDVGRVALDNWEAALTRLLRLGAQRALPVVLDEFGHLLEADPSLDSVVATALGPGSRRSHPGRSRLILCGSAIGMLGSLTAGQAPLRGRAGMELPMHPHSYRAAARWLGNEPPLTLAVQLFAVIGGVVGYATDMVDHDLPREVDDLSRWISQRVLSPAATLHHEAVTLLTEDPTLTAGNPVIHHGILGAMASLITSGLPTPLWMVRHGDSMC